MRVVYAPEHRLHDPAHEVQFGVPIPNYEVPARAEQIAAALEADGTFRFEPAREHGLAPVEAVHDRGLIRFLETAWRDWQAENGAPEMFPDTVAHPALREGMGRLRLSHEPRKAIGRLGYWCFETMTPIVAGTYAAARAAVDTALTAADLVLAGETAVYGLCRPPGHHVARGVYGGYCYLNNAAIAAQYVIEQTGGPVAILDVDFHHGNGTQQIFYARGDVLYVSLHADPARAFPYFTGYTDETGAGEGAGATLNLPLPPACADDDYLRALDRALERISAAPGSTLIVSLGLDTYYEDPLGDLALTTDVYEEIGRRVGGLGRRLIVLQEGGYFLPQLGENTRRWLRGAARPHRKESL